MYMITRRKDMIGDLFRHSVPVLCFCVTNWKQILRVSVSLFKAYVCTCIVFKIRPFFDQIYLFGIEVEELYIMYLFSECKRGQPLLY